MVTAFTAGLRASTRSMAAFSNSAGLTSRRRTSPASPNASYCSYSAKPLIEMTRVNTEANQTVRQKQQPRSCTRYPNGASTDRGFRRQTETFGRDTGSTSLARWKADGNKSIKWAKTKTVWEDTRMTQNKGVERSSTGIPGLDDILGGGLPRRRLYLVEGYPGAGKSTLSLQF